MYTCGGGGGGERGGYIAMLNGSVKNVPKCRHHWDKNEE